MFLLLLWASRYLVPSSPAPEEDTFKKSLKVMIKMPDQFSQGHRILPWPDHLPGLTDSLFILSAMWPDFLEFLLLTIWKSSHAQSYAISIRHFREPGRDPAHHALSEDFRLLSYHNEAGYQCPQRPPGQSTCTMNRTFSSNSNFV